MMHISHFSTCKLSLLRVFFRLVLLPRLPLYTLHCRQLERLLHKVPYREGPEEGLPRDQEVVGDEVQDPARERAAGEAPPLCPTFLCGTAAYQESSENLR